MDFRGSSWDLSGGGGGAAFSLYRLRPKEAETLQGEKGCQKEAETLLRKPKL